MMTCLRYDVVINFVYKMWWQENDMAWYLQKKKEKKIR
jgi:hypothetical protein